MKTLIKNCHLYAPDLPGKYLEKQDILIEGNIIQWIGKTSEWEETYLTVDGRGKLAIPGLVNAHTHSPENVLRGSTQRLPLELWLIKQFASQVNFPPRLTYLITLAGAAEMLSSGTTAVLDHLWMAETLTRDGLDSVMQAYEDSGMRASVAPMVENQDLVFDHARGINTSLFDPYSSDDTRLPASAQLEIVRDLIDNWHHKNDDRLRCLPGPGGAQWCSSDLLDGCRDLAQRYATGIHIHLAETRVQSIVCRNAYGHSAVKELHKLGLLNSGSSLAHCIWLDDTDFDLLAENRARVVHNPVSNLKLGSGIANLPEMTRRNIELALGTDGAASNDNQNMFAVLKLAGLLHSPAIWDTTWLSATQVFDMATVGGAKVLGYENLGRLQVGKLADIVLVDLARSYQQPLEDAANYLVFCETGASVSDVIVNGQRVIRERRVITFDESQIYQELLENLYAYHRDHPRPMDKLQSLMCDWSQTLAAIFQEGEL